MAGVGGDGHAASSVSLTRALGAFHLLLFMLLLFMLARVA
jgi:hypothetical protein